MGLGASSQLVNETIRIRIGTETILNNNAAPNKVKTTEYTLLTFLPMNLFNQFRRFANCYFLLVTIIAFFLVDCPISPISSMVPLIVVVLVGILKQMPEFYFRRRSDVLMNTAMVTVLRQGKQLNIESQYIMPGDLVVIKENAEVPCDLVLLQTTDAHGRCYVTTANLDGKTNLKTLYVPRELAELPIEAYDKMGMIECEAASSDLYSFNGKIELTNQTINLGADNLLLKGTHTQDTTCVIGCAVYLGMNTKLQLNSRCTSHKRSTIEKYLNIYIIGIVLVMIGFVTLFYLLERYDEFSVVPAMSYLGPPIAVNSFTEIFNEYFSLLILFNYMIPIWLYAAIEVYRVLGAYFIRWDLKLYDEATDQPCIVRTSDLNEELGQINVLFADKTGTLTKNEMVFQQCSINGSKYDFKGTQLKAEDTSSLYDINTFDATQRNFFDALAICHSVQVIGAGNLSENSNFAELNNHETVLDMLPLTPTGSIQLTQLSNWQQSTQPNEARYQKLPLNYHAASTDEKALVEACAQLGLVYMGDEHEIIRLRQEIFNAANNDFQYERLHILPFTPERRRMSVIVKDENGLNWIYTKGAEASVLPLCLNDENDLITQTDAHVIEFAKAGLRTLVIARKQIDDEEYALFLKLKQQATNTLQQHNELIEKCYATVECELELLGATAVEDTLQADVAPTLVALNRAGIKVWLLTGDNVETALSIALSCGHITADTAYQTILDCVTREELMTHFAVLQQYADSGVKTALLIDSRSLDVALALTPNEFRDVALKCTAVLCCRLNPLQKSQVVGLIRSAPEGYVTAAIGDGANDVAMLQAAHIGIAVIGKEARQAVSGSDFAIAQFSMLQRLFLVHGHNNVSRLTLLVLYYFYENVLIAGCMFMFQFYCMHSGTSVFDSIFLALYTTLYNSLPAIIISFTEKPYSEDNLMNYPELYTRVRCYRTFKWPLFLLWAVDGFIHAVQIFCAAYFIFSTNNVILSDGQTAGLSCFGVLIMQVIIIVSNLKLWIESKFMSYWYLGALAFSVSIFVLSTYIDNVVNNINDPGMYWAYNQILSSLPAWLFTIFATVACVFPDFGLRYLRESFKFPKTWSFAQSGFVRTLQEYNIIHSEEFKES